MRQVNPTAADSNRSNNSARIEGVDATRAIAVALTYAMHFSWFYVTNFLHIDPEKATLVDTRNVEAFVTLVPYFSLYGVYLFFMISGYLIASQWLRHDTPPIARYISLRATRIFPAFWVALLVAWGLAQLRGTNQPGTIGCALQDATLLNWFAPAYCPPALIVSWSLQIEWIFYLSMPMLAAALRAVPSRTRPFVLWCVAILVSAALKSIGERYFAYPLFFAVGIHVAIDAGAAKRLATTVNLWGVIAAVLALQIGYSALAPIGAQKEPWHFGTFDVFAAAFVFIGGALFVKIVFHPAQWLISKPILLLGRISYSFYLWHLLVLICVFDALHKFQWIQTLTAWSWLARWSLLMAVSIALSIVVSLVSYHALERPYFAYMKRLRQRD